MSNDNAKKALNSLVDGMMGVSDDERNTLAATAQVYATLAVADVLNEILLEMQASSRFRNNYARSSG